MRESGNLKDFGKGYIESDAELETHFPMGRITSAQYDTMTENSSI
jgi:hypothetical protein